MKNKMQKWKFQSQAKKKTTNKKHKKWKMYQLLTHPI